MKRFFSSLKKDIRSSSLSSTTLPSTSTSSSLINNAFKSEVHAQSATSIKRQEWIKKRNEMLTNTNTINDNDKIMDSNGFIKNVKKLGGERYEIKPVQSSADIYRQMRANGNLDQLNSGLGQTSDASSSSSSMWSSTIGLLTILGAVIAWNMTQSTTLSDATDIALDIDIDSTAVPSSSSSSPSTALTENTYSKQPLWLQRPRS